MLQGEKKNVTERCKIGINNVKQQIQNEHELIWDLWERGTLFQRVRG